MKRLFSLIDIIRISTKKYNDIIRISIKKYNETEIKNHYQYSRQFINKYLLYSHVRNEFGRFQLKTIFIYNHEPIVFPKPSHSLWIYFWRQSSLNLIAFEFLLNSPKERAFLDVSIFLKNSQNAFANELHRLYQIFWKTPLLCFHRCMTILYIFRDQAKGFIKSQHFFQIAIQKMKLFKYCIFSLKATL